ncbi:MAG: epoxyqueuosine reductase QueH, partial [Candidatus Cloacimonetes bacterium]|nr:epoxyqueuosine reductase QueH [Candidatus Cloacimonadota bacterium]
MSELLVHVCCAPCFTAPYFHLREQGFKVTGFWYNHNIHPYQEYRKRLLALQDFAAEEKIPMIYKDEYDLEKFLRQAAFREEQRCRFCYYDRLEYTAVIAKHGKFDAFTSTLLASKHQQQEEIAAMGEILAAKYDVPFYFQDFREYWRESIDLSKARGLYRQQYCGCIYSERDRYKGKGTRDK